MPDLRQYARAGEAVDRLKKGETISPEDAEAVKAVTGTTVPPEKITGTVESLKAAYDRAGVEMRDASAMPGGKAGVDKAKAKLDAAREALLEKAKKEYSTGSIPADRVKYLGGILGYSPADIAKRSGGKEPAAPSPYAKPPASRLTPAGAFMPAPVAAPAEGGAALAGGISGPALPAPSTTGAKLQPMVAPMPSKAGPIQGEPQIAGPGVPSGITAPPPPPPPMGATPAEKGKQASGVSGPEARAFWDYLQKIQGAGKLVADNPMYTKAFDDATPEEKARLIKENPQYFEDFRASMDLGTPGPGPAEVGPLNVGGKGKPLGGAAAGGGKAVDTAKPKFAEAAAGVPDWLIRLGEVLQAGLAGAHGETDIGKTAYGRRVAEAAEKAKAEDERALMEKWKNIERGWSVEDRDAAAAIEWEKAAREEALVKAGWSVEDARAAAERAAAFARLKYQTDAEAALAGKEAGAGLDWRTRAFGEVGD